MVGVSLGTLSGLMIGTGEGYFVGLSLGVTLGSPIGSPNPESDLPGMLMGVNIDLWFGSEAAMCLCCCRCLMDFHKAT